MQLLPYGNLGKGIVGTNAPDGLHVPSSGAGRMLLAFGIVIALGLLFDAAASRPVVQPAVPMIGFPTQQGSVR